MFPGRSFPLASSEWTNFLDETSALRYNFPSLTVTKFTDEIQFLLENLSPLVLLVAKHHFALKDQVGLWFERSATILFHENAVFMPRLKNIP